MNGQDKRQQQAQQQVIAAKIAEYTRLRDQLMRVPGFDLNAMVLDCKLNALTSALVEAGLVDGADMQGRLLDHEINAARGILAQVADQRKPKLAVPAASLLVPGRS